MERYINEYAGNAGVYRNAQGYIAGLIHTIHLCFPMNTTSVRICKCTLQYTILTNTHINVPVMTSVEQSWELLVVLFAGMRRIEFCLMVENHLPKKERF